MMRNRILVIDDEKNILRTIRGVLEDEGFTVEVAEDGELGLEKLRQFNPDTILLDIWMPGDDGLVVLEKIKQLEPNVQVIMMSGHGTVETAVKAIKRGAFDFLEKPLQYDKLLLLLQHVKDMQQLELENEYLRSEIRRTEKIIGVSNQVQKLKKLIKTAGPSNGWVLIQGENGTGKELVARALHEESSRSKQKFIR